MTDGTSAPNPDHSDYRMITLTELQERLRDLERRKPTPDNSIGTGVRWILEVGLLQFDLAAYTLNQHKDPTT